MSASCIPWLDVVMHSVPSSSTLRPLSVLLNAGEYPKLKIMSSASEEMQVYGLPVHCLTCCSMLHDKGRCSKIIGELA